MKFVFDHHLSLELYLLQKDWSLRLQQPFVMSNKRWLYMLARTGSRYLAL